MAIRKIERVQVLRPISLLATGPRGLAGVGAPTYSATAPTSPADKDLWVDTSGDPWLLKVYDADTETWQTVGAAGGGEAGVETVNALGNISGATEIDLADGTYITATLTDAIELSFTGLPDAGTVLSFTLAFTGLYAITWPAGTLYAGATPPTILGTRYDIACSIDSAGVLTVFGVLDNIAVDS